MLLKNNKVLPVTLAHNQVKRKQLIKAGELKSKVQTVNYAWLEAGESFTPHKHDDCEEIYFFLQGKGLMRINKKEFVVKKGDFVVVEVGEWHSLKNHSNRRLIFLRLK